MYQTGTHGSVGGRLANQSSASYPIARRAHTLMGESPKPPGSGKAIAKSKGVHREVESEGSWRQNFDLTNRNHEGCI